MEFEKPRRIIVTEIQRIKWRTRAWCDDGVWRMITDGKQTVNKTFIASLDLHTEFIRLHVPQ